MKEYKGYFEIRLESIGGLGANLCGKMLGELGVRYLDLNSTSFSSYGSEKTGTPVKGYIRYCDRKKEIRVHSPVVHPQLLAVFHQALMRDEDVWNGCNENTKALIALDGGREMEAVPIRLKECYVIPAQKIAMETHSRINMVMLGAIAKVMGFVQLEDVKQICRDTLGNKYPDALFSNLAGIERGFQEVTRQNNLPQNDLLQKDLLQKDLLQKEVLQKEVLQERTDSSNKAENTERNQKKQSQARWGYATAPIGGINPLFGNTVVADLSPSRQGYFPVFIKERCINCGLCDSTCPDMVFQFAKGEYKGKEMMVNQGLDYYHCKGCLRCVEICPVNALVRGVEAEHQRKDFFLPNQDLVRKPEYYLEAGPDGYITSESFFTEKRMEGGEV